MADWSTIASLATAGGTLILATATFSSVRSGNRSARIAEQALQIGLRPVLMHSRTNDPPQKIMWADDHWARVNGAGATVDVVDDAVYLAMSLRNAGSGIAVIQGWWAAGDRLTSADGHAPPEDFRPQSRDLYVPAGDVSFWQAALRDADDPLFDGVTVAVRERHLLTVDVLYSDHEGGQRTISRFSLAPYDKEGTLQWLCSVVKHWNLDRADPR